MVTSAVPVDGGAPRMMQTVVILYLSLATRTGWYSQPSFSTTPPPQ